MHVFIYKTFGDFVHSTEESSEIDIEKKILLLLFYNSKIYKLFDEEKFQFI